MKHAPIRPKILVLLTLLAIAVPAGADHCESFSTSQPELAVQPYYVDTEYCQIHWCTDAYVYEESNGIVGLQRADHIQDDTCHGSIRGDTIVF